MGAVTQLVGYPCSVTEIDEAPWLQMEDKVERSEMFENTHQWGKKEGREVNYPQWFQTPAKQSNSTKRRDIAKQFLEAK